MTRELNGWARPRPLRVAFLVGDGKHADLALDGIFADSYTRWGGRFSLIVPCADGRIMPSYWPWLEAYDPDIVYSYVSLSKDDILEIHERLCPSEYIFHEMGLNPRLDVFGFKPDYKFSPLSSLSVIFRLARYNPPSAGGAAPVRILDSWHTEKPSRLLTDNLGTYNVSQGGGMYPSDARAAGNLLSIVSPEKLADRRFGVPRDLNTIPSELAAFQEFVHGRAVSMSLASTLFASKLDIWADRWSASFNLVVGDSFTDRVLFWNARLLIPAWLDTDLCCFRVGLDQLKEPEVLAMLGDLLKHRNHVNGRAGGQPELTIRSASLTEDQLAEATKLVLSTKPWSRVKSEIVHELTDIVPSDKALQRAGESSRFGGGLFARPDWVRFHWTAPTAQPPAVQPDHLSDAPVRQLFIGGYWCTDFTFECAEPGPRFAMENRWMLPRRWRMAGAFKSSLVDQPRNALLPPARRSRDGNLAICVCADHPIEAIEIPSVSEAIRYALAADGAWAERAAEHGRIQPPAKVAWLRPSNEARYLAGVLGMTGGIQRATEFLLHPFLRENFARLGGTPNVPADKIKPTVNRLLKKAQRKSAFDLKNEAERGAVADLILKAARTLESPMDFLKYDELKKSWKTYLAAYSTAHPQEAPPVPDKEWDELEERSLDECLIELRKRKLMFQGHQWTCQKCHHKNWIDFTGLSSELACEVCNQSSQSPVDIHWRFRPNEFLIESLRDHSVLSLIWALAAFRQRARHSFIFAEPTWFGFTDNSSDPDTEADLLLILDGKTVLCEVKSSWRVLRPIHIDNLISDAKRLRPDLVVLAVMDTGSGHKSKLAAAKTRLSAENIDFELLTTDMYMPDGDSLLGFSAEE